MITLVTVLHVLVCVFLIVVILLQAGKGGGMGAAFGGAGSQTVFGGRGAQTIFGKITAVFAGLFMITSLFLAYQSSQSGSVVERDAAQTAPFQGTVPTSPPANAPESTPPMNPAPQQQPANPAQ
ncbi:MAG TPA: preprotein translocase subunit SecG [Anaeromyxobacteraceae bacterium]|nr:preprotein translocase subunit SecG [Anaeromyxobacteraceae bacterium]